MLRKATAESILRITAWQKVVEARVLGVHRSEGIERRVVTAVLRRKNNLRAFLIIRRIAVGLIHVFLVLGEGWEDGRIALHFRKTIHKASFRWNHREGFLAAEVVGYSRIHGRWVFRMLE